jgi:two-component system, LytTR family, sensor kinase
MNQAATQALAGQSLVVLLLKLAVAASAASILVRFDAFQRTLLREDRTIPQQLRLALVLGAVFGAGVATRVITGGNYQAADLGVEGAFLAGLIGGYVPGLVAAVIISVPAMLGTEYLSMPLFAAVGVLGGLLRDGAPELEEVWRLSPFPDRKLYRALRHRDETTHLVFQSLFLLAVIVVEALRFVAGQVLLTSGLFTLYPLWNEPGAWTYLAILMTTVLSIVLPLKIWANARTERKLEAQVSTLQEARLRALTSQINPHFLFNTLNSVASLVRTNPDAARTVIVKLSNILRRLMRKTEAMTTLGHEVTFLDDYLSIEMVRFGDKLKFIKEISPEALEAPLPSMLLQPIVENSLKHGLANKLAGGTIWLRARLEGGMLAIEIEDDGAGIPEDKLTKLFEQGIGVSNVNERLEVLYGETYRIWVDSRLGQGTKTGIEIPARTKNLAAAS